MATVKISALPAVTLPLAGTEVLPIVQSATTDKITASDLVSLTNLSGLGTGVGTFLATPSSANLASAVTGETGTGALVFGTSPTISSPVITNIAPGADFTLTQNSVAAVTSVNSGAIVNTLYLKAGQVGIGTTAPDSPLTLSGNSAAPPAPESGVIAHICGPDSTQSLLRVDAFGSNPAVRMYRANGTNASKSAISTDNVICSYAGLGYGATGYSSDSRGAIAIQASENWTDSAQGTYLTLQVTNTGTTTRTVRFRLQPAGTLTLSAYGAGTLTSDASGNITSVSDERLKDIHGSFDAGLEEIEALEPIVYRWKPETGLDTEHDYVGFGAQSVKSIIPEAVGMDDAGNLSLSDRPLIAALVNAVKELSTRIALLEAKAI